MAFHEPAVPGAAICKTPDFLRTRIAIEDTVEVAGFAAICGSAGLGKTLAVEHAIAGRPEPYVWLELMSRPSTLTLARQLHEALTGARSNQPRTYISDELRDRLGVSCQIVVIDESQRLDRDCIEYLRWLRRLSAGAFAVILVGGNGTWETLCSDPMLASRVHRPVTFKPLSPTDVLATIPGFHALYADTPPELIAEINSTACHGDFRNWATFTITVQQHLRRSGHDALDARHAHAALRSLEPHTRRYT